MIKLKDHVYSVGVQDADVRIFHGYEVPFGTSYNAYLIEDGENTILVDNVKAQFTEEFIRNIEEIVPLEKINIIIQNHIEPDHSGSLPEIARRLPNALIYCTAGAKKGLQSYYGGGFNCHVVQVGETLCTGKYTFSFLPAPMVHWPDSMLTYLAEEKMLFSNDAFGQHICQEGCLYDDDLTHEQWLSRVADYYANIVMPFGAQVTRLLAQATALDIEMILPAHGVINRTYIAEILDAYTRWAENESDESCVVIAYDSMWGATEGMAKKIAAEYEAQGKAVTLYALKDIHPSAIMGEVLRARYIFIGASTLNRNVMPNVAAFLAYLRGLAPKQRIGMAFGSYGWSGEAVGQVEKIIGEMQWELLPSRKQVYMGL